MIIVKKNSTEHFISPACRLFRYYHIVLRIYCILVCQVKCVAYKIQTWNMKADFKNSK